MITNIEFNKKYKQFAKDTKTPHPLKKYNLFYGMNGTGKSTLSRLFYVLEEYQKNPNFNINDSKYSEIQNAQLTYENTIIDWNNLADFYQHDVSVRVFNQEYIRNTINKQESTECDAIFVFGGDNQTLKNELATLKNEKQTLENKRQIKVESKTQSTNPSFDSSQHAKNIRKKIENLSDRIYIKSKLETDLKNKSGIILTEPQKDVCIKVIKNNKEYTDHPPPQYRYRY